MLSSKEVYITTAKKVFEFISTQMEKIIRDEPFEADGNHACKRHEPGVHHEILFKRAEKGL